MNIRKFIHTVYTLIVSTYYSTLMFESAFSLNLHYINGCYHTLVDDYISIYSQAEHIKKQQE